MASTCPPAPNNFAIGGAHTSNAPSVYPDPLLDPDAPEIDVKAELSRDPIPEEARSVWNSVVQDLDAAVASRASALRVFLKLEEHMSRAITSFGVRALLSPSVRAALAFEQSPAFIRLRPELDRACQTWNIPPCVLVFCHLDQVPSKQARLIRNASKTGTPFPTSPTSASLHTILEVNESTISTSPGFPNLMLHGNITQRRGSQALSARQSQYDVKTHAGKGASDSGSCESLGNDYSSAQEYHGADVLGSDDEAVEGGFLYSHRARRADLNKAANNDEEDPERGRKAESRQPSPFSESILPVEDKSRQPSPFSESIPPVEDKFGVEKLPDLEPSPFGVNSLSSSLNVREMDDDTDNDGNGNNDEVVARPRKRSRDMSAQSAEYMSLIGSRSWLSSEVVSRCVGVIVTSCKPIACHVNGQGRPPVAPLLHLNEAEKQVRRLLPGPEWFLREMACPQQPNGFDCGVYVIRNLVYLAADQPIPAPVDVLL
ncbi:Ulp1 protease family protein [Colletotrichum graminicola]|nr:Ulp1 protease family protein [Colletotrichum graminicola]